MELINFANVLKFMSHKFASLHRLIIYLTIFQ